MITVGTTSIDSLLHRHVCCTHTQVRNVSHSEQNCHLTCVATSTKTRFCRAICLCFCEKVDGRFLWLSSCPNDFFFIKRGGQVQTIVENVSPLIGFQHFAISDTRKNLIPGTGWFFFQVCLGIIPGDYGLVRQHIVVEMGKS